MKLSEQKLYTLAFLTSGIGVAMLFLLSSISPLPPTPVQESEHKHTVTVDNLYTTPSGSVISYSYLCSQTAFFDRHLEDSYIGKQIEVTLDKDSEFTTIHSISLT